MYMSYEDLMMRVKALKKSKDVDYAVIDDCAIVITLNNVSKRRYNRLDERKYNDPYGVRDLLSMLEVNCFKQSRRASTTTYTAFEWHVCVVNRYERWKITKPEWFEE